MSCKQQASSTALPSDINRERALACFKSHRDVLTTLLRRDLPKFANCLYAKSLIPEAALEEAMNPTLSGSLRVVSLLSVVEDRIRAEPHTFTEFVGILESEPTLQSQATELILKYSGSCDALENTSSSVISRYGEYLKEVYSITNVSNDGKFPPTPSNKFINLLAVVKNKHDLRDLEQLRKLTLHGKVEEILEGKTKIEIDDILQKVDNGCPVSLVFIEGPPGIGKSTLAWELCRRWDRKQYDLAVLLRLREREIQQMENVADLFYHDSTKLKFAVAEEVVEREGKGVLFILDGYDELPPGQRHKSKNLLNRLLTGRSLPKCTVVVTSRPSASHDLKRTCGSRIQKNVEILGFTQEYVNEYASSIFTSDSKALEEFLTYVSASKNPAINSLMYIPLNAAIVVQIYRSTKKKNLPIPNTLTKLYTQLCLVLLQRYIKSTMSCSHDNADEEDILTNFSNLSSPFLKQFQVLSKVAYETFKEHKIVFCSEDVPKKFLHLGFLNSVTSLYSGRGVSYNFLHLTLHEFLTAYYIISQLSKKMFKTVFRFRDDEAHWNLTWKFVSGLSKFKYFKPTVKYDPFARKYKKKVEVTVFLMQCLFEAQIDLDFRKIYKRERITVKSDKKSSQMDRYAIGYCIANSSISTVLWTVKLKDKSDEAFIWGLMSASRNVIRIECLKLHSIYPLHLSKYPLSILQGIKYLEVSNYSAHPCYWSKELKLSYDNNAIALSENLQKMSNLTTLSLSHHATYITDSMLALYTSIGSSSITALKLQCHNYNDTLDFRSLTKFNILTDENFRTLLLSLLTNSHTSVRCLSVVINNVDLFDLYDCTKIFCNVLFGSSCLQLLSFSLYLGDLMPDSLTMLETNTCLTSVHILISCAANYLPMLSKLIERNKTLKILTFGYISYDYAEFNEDVQNFNRALYHNVTLSRCILSILFSIRKHMCFLNTWEIFILILA